MGNRDVTIPYREIEPGILLVDKPQGISSYDVIRVLRKRLDIKKMGHAGTLDPNATGLMILAHGTATKRLTEFLKLPKTYEAEILFGTETDTGDTTGKIVREEKDFMLGEILLKNAIEKIKGTHLLPVPAYSAMKVAGKSLYKRALTDTLPTIPKREMIVRNAQILSITSPKMCVLFDVESGTYIRSLAEEIGRQISLPTTLSNLRRTKIGKYNIEMI